jgi:hypothetical protein
MTTTAAAAGDWAGRCAADGFCRKRALANGVALWRRRHPDGTVVWRAVRADGSLAGSHIAQPTAKGHVGAHVDGDYAAGSRVGFDAWRELVAALPARASAAP